MRKSDFMYHFGKLILPREGNGEAHTDHRRMNNTSYFLSFRSVMKICMRRRAGRVGKRLFKSPGCEAKSAVSQRD